MPGAPKGREKHITGTAESVSRRGEGLGIGPVGTGKSRSGAALLAGAIKSLTKSNKRKR